MLEGKIHGPAAREAGPTLSQMLEGKIHGPATREAGPTLSQMLEGKIHGPATREAGPTLPLGSCRTGGHRRRPAGMRAPRTANATGHPRGWPVVTFAICAPVRPVGTTSPGVALSIVAVRALHAFVALLRLDR